MDPNQLLKAEEVAELLSVGRTTVYELMRSGDLEPLHIGRRIRRFRYADIVAWIDEKQAA